MGETKICAKCGQEITEQILNADGACFHPECFTCDSCNANLTAVYKKDGKRLCADCAMPKCEICKKSISGPAMTCGGKSFHPECFKCAGCHQPMTSYFDVDGQVMCKSCAEAAQKKENKENGKADITGKICKKCKKPITGKLVLGDRDDPFHEECFVCDSCGDPLDDYVIDPNRRFKFQEAAYLCKKCGGEPVEIVPDVKVKNCYICGETCPVIGPDAKNVLYLLDGHAVHSSCIKCNTCGAVKEKDGPHSMTNRLLRTQVEKCKKGTYQCDNCFHGAATNLGAAPDVKVTLTLPHGAYLGKETDVRKGTQVAYLVKLLEGGVCSFERRESGFDPPTSKYGSRWVAEGTYTEDHDNDGHITAIRFTVSKRSSEVGDSVLVIEVKKGQTNSALICNGINCPLQLGVPDYELEQMMKPPERQAVKAVPQAKSADKGHGQVHVTDCHVMERPDAPSHGIIREEAKEVAPVSALPTEVPEGFMSLEDLRDPNIWKARGVDPSTREEYLSADAFVAVFGKSKEDFANLPKWKKDKLKKDHGLF